MIRSVTVSVTVPVSVQRDRVTRKLAPSVVKGLGARELAEVLARRGWSPLNDGSFSRERGAVRERVDPRTRELEITVSAAEATVEAEGVVRARQGASSEEVEHALNRGARDVARRAKGRLSWSEAAALVVQSRLEALRRRAAHTCRG